MRGCLSFASIKEQKLQFLQTPRTSNNKDELQQTRTKSKYYDKENDDAGVQLRVTGANKSTLSELKNRNPRNRQQGQNEREISSNKLVMQNY